MLKIIYLESKNPYWNLAYENCLMLDSSRSANDEYIVFYQNLAGIVVGRSQEKEKEVFLNKLDQKKIGISVPKYCIRRFSGGGTVYHGRGNINYAVLLPLKKYPGLFAIHESYHFILTNMIKALLSWQQLYSKGLCDISIKNKGYFRKVSGNAQYRKRNAILHHGTFIIDNEPLAQISKYLRQPIVQPDYRENRSHKDFLASYIKPLNQHKFIQLISQYWSEVTSNNIKNYSYIKLSKEKMFNQYGTSEVWKNSITKLQH